MGILLRSCEVVCEPIELSFGMVSGLGPSIDVRNGGPRASREGSVSGIFWHLHPPIRLNGQKCI